MADNTALETVSTPGDTIATDDIGGIKFPRSKIVIGADGTNDGDVSSANPLPVDLGTNNDVTLATLPDTAAGDLAAINAALAGTLTVGSHAVTNAGTFAVQATLDAETTKVIGTVNIAAAQTVAVTNAGTFATQATQAGTWTVDLGATDNAVLDSIVSNTASGAVVGGGLEATALRVTIASDSTGVVSIDDGGGSITVDGTVAVSGTVTVDLGANNDVTTGADATAGAAHGASQTGFRVFGSDGTNDVQFRTDATGNLQVEGTITANAGVGTFTTSVPSVATGGATPGKLISSASTNATSVKASAATLYSLQVFNTNAAARYLKIYNKASAPTVGTDTPVQVYTIPGNTAGAGLVVPIPTSGIALSTGFAFATTTGAADSDTAAVAANEIVVSYSYK